MDQKQLFRATSGAKPGPGEMAERSALKVLQTLELQGTTLLVSWCRALVVEVEQQALQQLEIYNQSNLAN